MGGSDSQISYNFHKAVLRREGEVIAEVHTSVDTDGSDPMFFLTYIDHYAPFGQTDERRFAITFTRADAFRLARAKLEWIDDRKGGEIEFPPGFPDDARVPVRRRGTLHLRKGRAHVS